MSLQLYSPADNVHKHHREVHKTINEVRLSVTSHRVLSHHHFAPYCKQLSGKIHTGALPPDWDKEINEAAAVNLRSLSEADLKP